MVSTSYRLTCFVVIYTIGLTGIGSALHVSTKNLHYNEVRGNHVEVTCIAAGLSYRNKIIMAIQITRQCENDPLATIVYKEQTSVLGPRSKRNMRAEGYIDNGPSDSYLKLTIKDPSIEDTGVYRCLIFLLEGNHIMTKECDTTHVTFAALNELDTTARVNELAEKLQEQTNKIDYLTEQHEVQKTLIEKLNKDGTQKQTLIDHIQQQIRKHESQIKNSTENSCCPSGWAFYKGDRTCLKFFNTKYTWSEARKSCKNFGGDLVIIRDEYKNNFVFGLIVGSRDAAWIGVKSHERRGFYWKYVDNSHLGSFHPWIPGEPDGNLDNHEDCVFMSPFKHNHGNWADFSCSISHPYVCSKY